MANGSGTRSLRLLITCGLMGGMVLASACSTPTPVATQGGPPVVWQAHQDPRYSFDYPAGWIAQGAPLDLDPTVNQHDLTLSTSAYSKFRFTIMRQPIPNPGYVLSMAELCTLQDEIRVKYPRGTFEKKDYKIDGALACYGLFREADLDVHVVTTVMDGYYYTLYFQYTHKALFDDTKARATADMERLLGSWKWKRAAASPSPSPSPSQSSAPPILEIDDTDYFPVGEGYKWIYHVLKKGVNQGSMTATVTKLEPAATDDDPTRITIERKWILKSPIAGKASSETLVYEKEAGLRLVTDQGKISLIPWLNYEGADWSSHGSSFSQQGYETVATVLGPLPGALKVLETKADGSTLTSWYTWEYGLIQSVETPKGGEDITLSLADYTFP